MFDRQLKEMMKSNGSDYELFEIWNADGAVVYGFMDNEGMHHFSTEQERATRLA